MQEINTIDLWTEPEDNYLDCFYGAFIDGVKDNYLPYDSFKVLLNCNCIISSNVKDVKIANKHNAIVFYKNLNPIRLAVFNKNTSVENCIDKAINQKHNGKKLKDIFLLKVKRKNLNLKEVSIFNEYNNTKETDVCSCDRLSLLNALLNDSYTESVSLKEKKINNNYIFLSNIKVNFKLITDSEVFNIMHSCAFINKNKTKIILIQENSKLIKKDFDKLKELINENS